MGTPLEEVPWIELSKSAQLVLEDEVPTAGNTVTYDRNPEVGLVKQLADGQDFSAAGDTVIYYLLVTNTGSTILSDITDQR